MIINSNLKTLKSIYASCRSELTNMMQYLYQKTIVEKDLVDDIEELFMMTKYNFEKLGNLIYSKKVNPTFFTFGQIPWTARSVNYSLELKNLLFADLKNENRIKEEYSLLINKTFDKNEKEILNELYENKQKNIKKLQNLIKKYGF